MSAADLVAPEPKEVLAPSGAAALERWADRERAELEVLATALRTAEAEASAAERGLVVVRPDRTPAAPLTFIAVVDAMLATTVTELDDEIDAARRQAAAIVATAIRDSAVLLQSAGADPANVLSSIVRGPRTSFDLPRPKSAVALWQEVSAADDGSVGVSTDAHPAGGAREPEAFDDVADVYDLFWDGLPEDRPVRELIRRLAQRPPS